MGVVRRQGLKRTTVAYLGVVIGALSNLFVYPLNWEIYGLAQFILSSASLLIPFASFGVSRLTVRYYPDFKDEGNNHNGLLPLLWFVAVTSFGVFSLLIYFLQDSMTSVLESLGMNSTIFVQNEIAIIAISFLMVLSAIASNHSSNFKLVVVPEIFTNLLFKITLPVLVLLTYAGSLGVGQFKTLLITTYVFSFFCLILYLHHIGQFGLKINFRFLSKERIKGMLNYGVFSALSTVGYLISFRIDNVMVTSYLGVESTGMYSFFAYMSNTIIVPFLAITSIASPIIAQAYKDGDSDAINKLYKQSSEVLFTFGLLISLLIWISIDEILVLTGDSENLSPSKYVFLLLASSQIFNLLTSLNEPIISYSHHFRFNLYAQVVLAILNLTMNVFFIPRMGLTGAALATAISIAFYNFLKSAFIYLKFKHQPFTVSHIFILCSALLAYSITTLLNPSYHFLTNLAINSLVFVFLFVGPLIYFKRPLELSKFVSDIFNKFRSGS